MRKQLTRIILYLVILFIYIGITVMLFRSDFPLLWIPAVIIFLIVVVNLPYKKMFNQF